MTKTIMLEASMPAGDGRKTTYPARNWPAVAFYHVQRELVKIFRDGHLPSSPHAACIDALLDQLSDTLEEVELIGLTMAPLPYAQVTRWITLAFLVFLPFESVVRCRHTLAVRPHAPHPAPICTSAHYWHRSAAAPRTARFPAPG